MFCVSMCTFLVIYIFFESFVLFCTCKMQRGCCFTHSLHFRLYIVYIEEREREKENEEALCACLANGTDGSLELLYIQWHKSDYGALFFLRFWVDTHDRFVFAGSMEALRWSESERDTEFYDTLSHDIDIHTKPDACNAFPYRFICLQNDFGQQQPPPTNVSRSDTFRCNIIAIPLVRITSFELLCPLGVCRTNDIFFANTCFDSGR